MTTQSMAQYKNQSMSRFMICLTIQWLMAFATSLSGMASTNTVYEIHSGSSVNEPQIIATEYAILILAPDSSVWGWGRNPSLLGTNETESEVALPVRQVDVGSNWVSLAAESAFALGIKSDKSLCGWSYFHKVHGFTDKPNKLHGFSYPPVTLLPGKDWMAVAAGENHALALRKDGKLWAWGLNSDAAVGNGTRTRQESPIQIGTNQKWIKIAAGRYISMGLQNDGSLWHWGMVYSRVRVREGEFKTVPTRFDSRTDWHEMQANPYYCLASRKDGSIWIWNRFVEGTNAPSPHLLDSGKDWKAYSHLLVLKKGGSLWSSGNSEFGQAGRTQSTEFKSLTLVDDQKDWVKIWAKGYTSFGLTKDGTLWTWGKRLDVKADTATPVTKPWPLLRFVNHSQPK